MALGCICSAGQCWQSRQVPGRHKGYDPAGQQGQETSKKSTCRGKGAAGTTQGAPTPSWGGAATDMLKHEPSWPNHKEQEEAPEERTGWPKAQR